MVKYKLDLPPPEPGVYRLKNTNGLTYIGSTSNLRLRMRQWQGTAYGAVSHSVELDALFAKVPTGWEFEVLEVMPGADIYALMGREKEGYKAEVRAGNKGLLNKQLSFSPPMHKANALSTIVSETGVPMSYADAARMTGYSNQGLYQKMARLRGKGIFQVSISELVNNGRGRPRKLKS